MEHREPNDLTPAERAAWASLPDAREAPARLEARTVRLLRREGLLRALVWGRGRRLAALALAAVALFALGVAVGARLAAPTPAAVATNDLALQLQRAGSEYVRALGRLDALQTADASRTASLEVARTTFYGAARELARVDDPETLAGGVLHAGRSAGQRDGDGKQLIWF